MALVSTLAPSFTLGFKDNNDKDGSMTFYLPDTVDTLAAALTSANALRTAIAPLTNARIVGGTVTFPLDETVLAAYVPESEIERKLVVPFVGSNRRQTYNASVPSVVFSVEQSGTDVVPADNALVAAFLSAVLANAVTNRSEALVSLGGRIYVDHRKRYTKR